MLPTQTTRPLAPAEMSTLRSLDSCVLVAYVVGVVGLGCWFARRSTKSDAFMIAGGSLPGWIVGMSVFGTYVSSISFLANPGKSYSDNWNPFVFSLSLPIAAWIATRWFVPFYRNEAGFSAYAHLEDRFGAWARMYAVGCFLLTQVARTATILYLVALALSPMTGWDIRVIILVTGVLVTAYTLLGGIEAVIWTDMIQSVVLTGGILISLLVLFLGMPEGPTEALAVAASDGKFSLGGFQASLTQPTFWVVLLYGVAINLQNFGIDQSYVQRYLTAESEAAAKKSVWLGTLLYVPVSALLFLLGTSLFAFYAASPELLPDTAGGVKADEVFPHFIVTQLPPGLTGLLVAAVFAAAMSSVDSSLNSSATLVLCDVYKRYWRPEATEKESIAVLYSATLFWGVVGTVAALGMINAQSVLDVWWLLAGVFSGGVLGLFLLGLLFPRARSAHAAVAVTAGGMVIMWMSLSAAGLWPASWTAIKSPMNGLLTIVFGTLTILIVGSLLAKVGPRHPKAPLAKPGA